jgi:hypothetical protein
LLWAIITPMDPVLAVCVTSRRDAALAISCPALQFIVRQRPDGFNIAGPGNNVGAVKRSGNHPTWRIHIQQNTINIRIADSLLQAGITPLYPVMPEYGWSERVLLTRVPATGNTAIPFIT